MQTSTPNPQEDSKMPQANVAPVEPISTPSSTEVSETLTHEELSNTPPPKSDEVTRESVISFKNVDIYQRKLLVLSKISFDFKSGEFIYLVGKTGSGKSSILRTMIADIKPKGEQALMIGYDLLTMKSKQIPELRKKIGMVFQDYQLLSDMTVLDNLLFMLKATRWKDKQAMINRCQEVLSLVGLETKDFKLPSQLSGGEQQRVCIARALLNHPEVILADEPTGNLDPITTEEIFNIFHHINQSGTTVVMATHNFSMINKFPSRSILIEDGKLLDSGI